MAYIQNSLCTNLVFCFSKIIFLILLPVFAHKIMYSVIFTSSKFKWEKSAAVDKKQTTTFLLRDKFVNQPNSLHLFASNQQINDSVDAHMPANWAHAQTLYFVYRPLICSMFKILSNLCKSGSIYNTTGNVIKMPLFTCKI